MYWKEELFAKLENRMAMKPMRVANLSNIIEDEFRVVRSQGTYDYAREMQVLHQSYDGKVGTHVLTPFKTKHGTTILVNRGWVPYEHDFLKPEGELELYGVIRKDPRKGHFALENEAEKNIWYNIDLPQMNQTAPDIETDFYVEAQAPGELDEKVYPLALPKKIHIYNQHMQYVITWFGISLALVLMYYFRFFHKPRAAKK